MFIFDFFLYSSLFAGEPPAVSGGGGGESGIFLTKLENLVQRPTALLQIICNELAIFGFVLPNQNREPPRKIYKPDFSKNC